MAVIGVTCVVAPLRPTRFREGQWVRYTFRLFAFMPPTSGELSAGVYTYHTWDCNYLEPGLDQRQK